MCNKAICLLSGVVIGIVIGYEKENEIDDLARQTKRTKKKVLRRMHQMKDHFED